MLNQKINDDNFLMIAMHYYDNMQCASLHEFEEDLKRFAYLKKLFNRYRETNELKERLILNHIIILYNLFGIVTTELLFFKIDKPFWNTLATFLVYLDKMPDQVPEFNIKLSELTLDLHILQVLEGL